MLHEPDPQSVNSQVSGEVCQRPGSAYGPLPNLTAAKASGKRLDMASFLGFANSGAFRGPRKIQGPEISCEMSR